jgi:hypothetical protein
MSAPSVSHLNPNDSDAVRAFIIANTKLLAPPLVPEIKLHLAEESVPLWQKTEEELGEMNIPPPYWAFAWAGGQALARHLLDTPSLCAGKRFRSRVRLRTNRLCRGQMRSSTRSLRRHRRASP